MRPPDEAVGAPPARRARRSPAQGTDAKAPPPAPHEQAPPLLSPERRESIEKEAKSPNFKQRMSFFKERADGAVASP